MQNKVENWMELCALAAQEQDPKKLMELTNEILRLLDEKRERPMNRRGTLDDQEASSTPVERPDC
jgi:hypothetical protein